MKLASLFALISFILNGIWWFVVVVVVVFYVPTVLQYRNFFLRILSTIDF